ncbi:MAG: septum formation initiator family protein [Pseudomonadota bacterium]
MNTLRRFAPTLALAGFIAYLGFHALSGEGYVRYLMVEQRIATAERELAEARAHRAALADRVTRLHADRGELDLDLLAERSREVLNFGHPDEIVIRLQPVSPGY